jgi:polyisoprenyl-teichoic acid--peptidoglycan teichoic acid transferase
MPRGARRPWLIAISVIGVIVLALVGGAAVFLASLAQQFDKGTEKIADAFPDERVRVPEATGPAASAQNILLLGTDSRSTLQSIDDADGNRADTMMVVHIPSDRTGATVMSIMRDSWVEIPGHGTAKVNAALSFGGVPLAVQTVESIIGARIDHVAIVDFEGFIGLTEALGGVTVDNAVEFDSSHLKGMTFPSGPINLDGEQALAFTRERYAFVDGDYQRVRNQQAFLGAILDKLLSPDTALNPARVSEVIGAIAPYLKVDSGFTGAYAGGLAVEMRNVRKADVEFFTIPTLGTGTSDDGQSIVLLDDAKLVQLREAFASDSLDAAAFAAR